MDLHKNIKEKLDYFYYIKKIPHILFHGPAGSGKKTLVHDFINKIYKNNKENIKTFTLYVNCAHKAGIKFIREDLKLFAKTNIYNKSKEDFVDFKTIILINADSLTIDAQSALRRCIESYSYSTRFFLVVENKNKMLKPIISRFCEFYIPNPTINKKIENIYKYNINKKITNTKESDKKKEFITKIINQKTHIVDKCNILYEKSYSCLDLLKYIEETNMTKYLNDEEKYELLVCCHKNKKEIRNEKVLIYFTLHFLYFKNNISLENITFL